jgi:hypothetical protein
MSDGRHVVLVFRCNVCTDDGGPMIGNELERHVMAEHGVTVVSPCHYRLEPYTLDEVIGPSQPVEDA